jgi:acetyltransferase-like isoleucine patch superfamily enzyme
MSGMRFLDDDWYGGGIPLNVEIGPDVYVDTSYGFDAFHSRRRPGLVLGEASGAYDRSTFVVGPEGLVTVGPYTVLNGTYLICTDSISIGAHCLLAWGTVLADTWAGPGVPTMVRRAAMEAAARDAERHMPAAAAPKPVILEDNVWVGFDSVVLPGVTLGRGCVVGCKTVVGEDVAPYAVVAGDPPRVIRQLNPDDTDAARDRVLREAVRA